MSHSTIISDGSFSFDGGVNSQAVTTVKSALVPHGLDRNSLSWLSNAIVRGGAIGQRPGLFKLLDLLQTGLWQGGIIYDPIGQDTNPFLVCSISGHIYKVLLDPPFTVTDLSVQFGLFNPPTPDQVNFCEGNGFLVIQAGDFGGANTLPLFYNTAFLTEPEMLRRSGGATRRLGTLVAVNTVAVNFVVSAVGDNNDVTLTAPYAGARNQHFSLNGNTYVQVDPTNFFVVKNIAAAAGVVVPAGTEIRDGANTLIGKLLAPFIAPVVGASATVFVAPTYAGGLPLNVSIFGGAWQITAVGNAAPAANHVFLVNLTDTPGNTVIAGTTLDYVVSAVGLNTVFLLSAPFTGGTNQIVTLGSGTFIEVDPGNFFTLKNVAAGNIGGSIPAGTQLFDAGNNVIGSLLAPLVIPPVGATAPAKVTPTFTGALPANITINGEAWQITVVGTIAPGPNQVFLVNLSATPGSVLTGSMTMFSQSELPAATCMIYYMGRIWYAQGRIYTAGDMEKNQSSGTAGFQFGDSVLKVTENPLAVGGDGFTVPSQAGNIRALAYTANMDTTLGQGPLYIFTRKQVYSLNVPVTRADWIAANNTNQPVQTVSQINSGAAGERGIVHVNGDLFYQSFDPAVRSLIVATRFYQQWGNLQISNNVNRALQFNDRGLMRFASGIEFDNRLLECVLPKQTPSGVVCSGILPLDFDLVSTLQEQAPPAWEGIWEGVDVLQLFTGDFGGLNRAFAVVVSRADQSIDVWEISTGARFDNAGTVDTVDNRIAWVIEFPAFTWAKEFELKQLHGAELWLDRVFGTTMLQFYYRPDASPCWIPWYQTSVCVARNCPEDVAHPDCVPYPNPPNFREGYRFPITLPAPPTPCDPMLVRPSNLGYQFQVQVKILGAARVRGLILYGETREKELYGGLSCS